MTQDDGLLPLNCTVQHYDWGDTYFIPSLLGTPNAAQEPMAELWIGAHPAGPSKVLTSGGEMGLDECIDNAPEALLGAAVAQRFNNRLPFLLKVLAAAKPLSIQAHPTKQQAETGFARETAMGKAPQAADRHYKDDNHKPELIVALTDFYALRGFRPLTEIADLLQATPEFRRFGVTFQAYEASLRDLYCHWMTLPQEVVNGLFDPLLARLQGEHHRRPYTKDQREYWLLRADTVFSKDGQRDRGLFSVYLLNLLHLKPGQAMYLPAREIHAYLEGAGMEVMANSDNVLRGGLTTKHVDVPELLNTLTFSSGPPHILEGERLDGVETIYRTPAPEFELHRLDLTAGATWSAKPAGAQCFILIAGEAVLAGTGTAPHTARRGEVFFVPAGHAWQIEARSTLQLFRAVVPTS